MADSPLHEKRKNDMDDDLVVSKRQRMYESNIVTFKTGKEAKVTTIHEDLLKNNSEFFRAALEKDWKEGKTRVIELPTDRHDVVVAYVDYLYRGEVEGMLNRDGDPYYPHLAHLYCFGEKILDDEFCDAVLRKMCDQCEVSNFFPGDDSINIIYAGTPSGSLMRAFMVHAHAKGLDASRPANDITDSELPVEFLKDVIMELYRLKPEPVDYQIDYEAAKKKWVKKKGDNEDDDNEEEGDDDNEKDE